MKVATVNVIEMVCDDIINLVSFSDDDDGNKEAEETFTNVIRENGAELNEVDACLENGFYVNNDYYASITHSHK